MRRPQASFEAQPRTARLLAPKMGIGHYRTPANPYYPANFVCRAFLPQPFKGSCYQFWCTITGGAYHSARRVTMCVRNNYKNWYLPELYPQNAPNASKRPFSPHSFPARRKRMGRRRHPQPANLQKHLKQQEGTTRENSLFS